MSHQPTQADANAEGAGKGALRLRIGTAFRWRHPVQTAEASDVLRVFDDGAAKVIALANAFDCGFSVCWPPGSRLILDCFEQSWVRTSGILKERLSQAFDLARTRFVDEAGTLIPDDADFPAGPAAVTLLVAVCQGTKAHLVWIGGDRAIQSRGFEVEV